MKLNKNIMRLISLLEYRIGSNVYNPNSYDGFTGKVGRGFRYPVTYENLVGEDYHEYKTRYHLDSEINENNIGSVRYKFGSNHLYVGDAIIDVLNLLERRYNLDFNELEKEVAKK